MHILLTDVLCCPRCGPEFGLVLLAHRVEERHVIEGELGCPNCRVTYPVRGGFGDFRPPPRDPLPVAGSERDGSAGAEGGAASEPGAAPEADREEAVRLGALLGLADAPGRVVLAGPSSGVGSALAAMVEDVRIVTLETTRPAEAPPGAGGNVSRIAAGPVLPFFSGTARGVVLEGADADDRIEEAARVVSPGGRVVVIGGSGGARDRLESAGLAVVLDEGGVVVASRE